MELLRTVRLRGESRLILHRSRMEELRKEELTKDFTPGRRQRIDDIKTELLAEMPLHELRRARALTQRDMAKMLKVKQPTVSKLEQRVDVYVSSLRSHIEAVGGKLKIVAEFPEGEVAITNFAQVGETEESQ